MSLTLVPAATNTSAAPAASSVVAGQLATGTAAAAQQANKTADSAKAGSGSDSSAKVKSAGGTVKLSDEAQAQLRKLQARDTQVRNHEQAHLAAAGGLATSGASYTYEKGPDGVSYAIGGEVHIDVSPGRTPQDTIARAQIIQAAALAPADPSGPDLAVAAQARQMEQQAQVELQQQQAQKQQTKLAGVYASISNTGQASTSSPAKVDSYA
ncbi:putative metalloprotease CJM1_0395 family protein [Undibacterium terreum]|nr:putative metalloprotease CJM1_0395 family protein [Undibacterium terreum]